MKTDLGLEQAFNPKSIAIVGVPRSAENHPPGYTGMTFIRLLNEGGYEGRIYPINPKAEVINGLKVFPNIQSLPEVPDLVILAVPVKAVVQVLRECVAAGARNVQVATAGFSETGEEEGKRVEEEMRRVAEEGGLSLVGPNCLGYHVPSSRMKMYDKSVLKEGPVAFLSQSGGHGQTFARLSTAYGVGISKLVSYGNALILTETDFLEYLAGDPDTSVIGMYIEGTRNGPRLLELVRQIGLSKPVVIWKGGITAEGARAAATHTSSLAGDNKVWDAFFKETGAIRTASIHEIMEFCMLYLNVKPVTSTRMVVFGGGGGNNVMTADVCSSEGIELPRLSSNTTDELRKFVTLVNQSLVNPMDAGSVFANLSTLERALETVCADPMVDVVLLHLGSGYGKWLPEPELAKFKTFVRDFSENNRSGKPVLMALHHDGLEDLREPFAQELRDAGIMAFSSLEKACRAVKRVSAYHRFVRESAPVAVK